MHPSSDSGSARQAPQEPATRPKVISMRDVPSTLYTRPQRSGPTDRFEPTESRSKWAARTRPVPPRVSLRRSNSPRERVSLLQTRGPALRGRQSGLERFSIGRTGSGSSSE